MATQALQSNDTHLVDSGFPSAVAGQWNLQQLLIASFLTLFAELALIRWLAVEVRIFAYFKNLALLLCFLGFGFGCSLARRRVQWGNALCSILVLLVVIRVPWPGRDQALANL